MKVRLLFLLFSILVFTQCANPTIRFKALKPAEISIPGDVKSVAVIDRSVPENKLLNILEGGLTGEGIGQDKLATQLALDGVTRVMQGSDRYHLIRTTEVLKGSKTGSTMPDPLPWNFIKEMTDKYNTDAILAIETFDSDFMVTDGTRQVERKDSDGNTVNVTRFYARGVATVNLGFRLYDALETSIIDQFLFSHNMDWEATGNSIDDAYRHLINKNTAVKDAAYQAGLMYGRRITPSWYTVTRTYFKKARDNPFLEEGARWMEANNWDNAVEALNKALDTGDMKSRGQAAHNLAVVNEILGDLEKAREWAQKAWAQYENKESKDYAYLLNRRISDQTRLENQMGE